MSTEKQKNISSDLAEVVFLKVMRYLSIHDDVWDSQKDSGIAFFGVA